MDWYDRYDFGTWAIYKYPNKRIPFVKKYKEECLLCDILYSSENEETGEFLLAKKVFERKFKRMIVREINRYFLFEPQDVKENIREYVYCYVWSRKRDPNISASIEDLAFVIINMIKRNN